MTEMTSKEVLMAAANAIEQRGLCKGSMTQLYDTGKYPVGSVCVIGAINLVKYGDPCIYGLSEYSTMPIDDIPEINYLAAHVADNFPDAERDHPVCTIASWNDRQVTTADLAAWYIRCAATRIVE